ncbi:MAG: PEP-CTERM sorting domain-containing protein [Acidobacteria bacterium]|nr:PEP-CTERM sorting domain-containing protein [Acidobacteriota bacterium]
MVVGFQTTAETPEPSAVALALLGLAAVISKRRFM